MPSLDAYIAQLTNFSNNLGKIVVAVAKDREQDILNIVRQRLLDKGQDANLSFIGGGEYAPSTIERKKKKGQESGHFTLFDEGGFHGLMFIKNFNNVMFIGSADSKTDMLINEYGLAILGLTEPETRFIVRWFIDPILQNIINNFPQTIDI